MAPKCLLLAMAAAAQLFCLLSAQRIPPKQTYIIQTDRTAKPSFYADPTQWHSALLTSVTAEPSPGRLLYTYRTTFHGLAARLTQVEAQKLEDTDGVTAVFPETMYKLHTTRTPDFLGLEPETQTHPARGHDVVVGVLDTGIWPESESFNDSGMTALPSSRWKGACETGRVFYKHHCNKKIVGARIFYRGYEATAGKINEANEYKSPRDQDGHGTHTAATVAGAAVRGASLFGYASGTARGMAPRARIAAYKVCWTGGCFSSDILSAVDRAVEDGVDVLSISLGGGVSSYYHDSLSVAAFAAMERGVFISCSAGNSGPDPVSLANVAPWIATVGASTIDRDFPAVVRLRSGETVKGVSLYREVGKMSTDYPIVYMGGNEKGSSGSPSPSSLCLEEALDRRIVAGKIVICDRGISPRVQKGQVVKDAGGVGMILANTAVNGEELVADSHLLPAVAIGEAEARIVKHYAQSNPNGTATLSFLGTRLGIRSSPVVASFSSRGPNFLTLEILKPDMVAPGVNILAAWTSHASPSGLATDPRRVNFNILSGTSMSCPHVSGVAALIKSRNKMWSPAAIKSALMTTAYIHDHSYKPLKDSSTGEPSTPFDHGAGHINPMKAMVPGLVYDIHAHDYLNFLCTQGLTENEVRVFSNKSCGKVDSPGNLNYPAISAVFPEKKSVTSLRLHRIVTNVGPAISNYHVVVSPFKGAAVRVEPENLHFTAKYQKLSYTVTFGTVSRQLAPEFGDLIWKDGKHKVRSPIVITWL